MAQNKKSFLLYADLLHTVSRLPDDKAGELFKLILSYVNDESPDLDSLDLVISIAFEPIRQQLKRDLNKWDSKREKRVESGRLGGLAKASNAKQKLANLAVTVNDTVSVNVNEEKIYTYNAFYDSEISKANSTNYTNFVKYLFGENMLKEKLIGVLSIKSQLTFDEYKKISTKCEVNKLKLGQILTKIENDVKYYKGKKSLYRTLLNWAEGRFAK